MMKRIIFIFLLPLTLGLIPKQSDLTLNGQWALICFEDLDTGLQDCKPTDNRTRWTILEFEDNGKSGSMRRNTMSNEVYAKYTLFENNKIKVEGFVGTRVGEQGWGTNFTNAFIQSSSCKYNADTLIILYNNDTKAMKFVPAIGTEG